MIRFAFLTQDSGRWDLGLEETQHEGQSEPEIDYLERDGKMEREGQKKKKKGEIFRK